MKGVAVGKCWKQRTIHGGEAIINIIIIIIIVIIIIIIHGGEPICQGGNTKADLMQIPASLDFEEYNLENSDATYSI